VTTELGEDGREKAERSEPTDFAASIGWSMLGMLLAEVPSTGFS